jgi:threonine/homoserine efflux transporter RhtA
MALAALSYLALPKRQMQDKWSSICTQPTVIALAFAILMNSVLKYSLQSFANKWVGATTLTVWMCLVPVLTAIVGVMWSGLGEKPSLSYLGALPVMIGVYMVTVARQSVAPQESSRSALVCNGDVDDQKRP